MIRALLSTLRAPPRGLAFAAPLAAAVLLAGCVTPGYQYREDRGGGYYYGTPSVEYREVTPYPYGAYPPGAYPYGPYRYGYYGPYAYPYGYGGYRYDYYGYPYGYPYRYVPRPRTVPHTHRTPDRPRSPWRDLDHLAPPSPPSPPPTSQPMPPPGNTGGLGDRIRRARERAAGRAGEP